MSTDETSSFTAIHPAQRISGSSSSSTTRTCMPAFHTLLHLWSECCCVNSATSSHDLLPSSSSSSSIMNGSRPRCPGTGRLSWSVAQGLGHTRHVVSHSSTRNWVVEVVCRLPPRYWVVQALQSPRSSVNYPASGVPWNRVT